MFNKTYSSLRVNAISSRVLHLFQFSFAPLQSTPKFSGLKEQLIAITHGL